MSMDQTFANVRQVYHESGRFEIEDATNVQESVERLISFSRH